jgi:hypothetical protein
MIKNNKKPYIVYSHKLMRHLGEKGFTPFATAPNTKYPTKIVFIYNNTEDLLEAIDEYLTNK